MDGDERYGVRQVCREFGTAVIAYSPLGECGGGRRGREQVAMVGIEGGWLIVIMSCSGGVGDRSRIDDGAIQVDG